MVSRWLISFFFFFSSRRRHTRFDCDWSSDVCSSDLRQSRGGWHSARPGCGRRRADPRVTRRDAAAALTLPVSKRDHIEGPADAAVTLVEYGDYECPHCGRAYPIIKDIQRRMGRRLRFVYRNFPLRESHPHAQQAAEAAEAAGAQGKFWEMHDRLFERQFALDGEYLIEYAGDLGLDVARFRKEPGAGGDEP